jgi:hypothetical protein
MRWITSRITGVGLSAHDAVLRFTIDKDRNVIFKTNLLSGEQLKRVIAQFGLTEDIER